MTDQEQPRNPLFVEGFAATAPAVHAHEQRHAEVEATSENAEQWRQVFLSEYLTSHMTAPKVAWEALQFVLSPKVVRATCLDERERYLNSEPQKWLTTHESPTFRPRFTFEGEVSLGSGKEKFDAAVILRLGASAFTESEMIAEKAWWEEVEEYRGLLSSRFARRRNEAPQKRDAMQQKVVDSLQRVGVELQAGAGHSRKRERFHYPTPPMDLAHPAPFERLWTSDKGGIQGLTVYMQKVARLAVREAEGIEEITQLVQLTAWHEPKDFLTESELEEALKKAREKGATRWPPLDMKDTATYMLLQMKYDKFS